MLRYLKCSPGHGFHPLVIFRFSLTLILIGLVCHTTHYISWCTKKQIVVSRSFAEAKYRSMASTTFELVFDLTVLYPTYIILYCDNQAALQITRNPIFHEQTKHIEIDCHYVHEKFRSGLVILIHISTKDQTAEFFTKALGKDLFHHSLHKLGIKDIHAPT